MKQLPAKCLKKVVLDSFHYTATIFDDVAEYKFRQDKKLVQVSFQYTIFLQVRVCKYSSQKWKLLRKLPSISTSSKETFSPRKYNKNEFPWEI